VIEYILFFIGMIMDVSLTRLNLGNIKKYKIKGARRKNWYDWEVNPIMKFLYKNHGLQEGFFLSVIVAIVINLIVILWLPREIILIGLGIYLMVNIQHIQNYSTIRILSGQKR